VDTSGDYAVEPDFIFGVTPGDITYDIETFPNAFTLCAEHTNGTRWQFEISDRRNQYDALCDWLDTLRQQGCRMVGFNNVGFDYPVLHYIYGYEFITCHDIYAKAMSIINNFGEFGHIIWDRDRIVSQVDLFKVHHFDNKAKMTSLKVLEFNMRMDSVEDLPFEVGTVLTSEQIDTLIEYNWHDVEATMLFYRESLSALKLRADLSASFGIDMTNMSDVKIGETLLVTEMEKHGVSCYYRDSSNRKQKKQTIRTSLALADVIFPYVKLEHPEFHRIHQWLAAQTITETKGVFTDLSASVGGLTYYFGTGGLHGSVDGEAVYSDERNLLIDNDVGSYYPNLGIQNNLYPEHLGTEFCNAYLSVYETRKTFPKKTPENEAYKLALNGAYGGSNNEHSPFLDMAYTMAITINGQLLLCMLIEQMIKVPGLRMIQANTDGVTCLCPREYLDHVRSLCRWWESVTKLHLEEALYSRMFVKDVNNYIAVSE
jgi:DNA polymerase elongation subunit (family B)